MESGYLVDLLYFLGSCSFERFVLFDVHPYILLDIVFVVDKNRLDAFLE